MTRAQCWFYRLSWRSRLGAGPHPRPLSRLAGEGSLVGNDRCLSRQHPPRRLGMDDSLAVEAPLARQAGEGPGVRARPGARQPRLLHRR